MTQLIDGLSDCRFTIGDERDLPDEKMAILISPPNDDGRCVKFFLSPRAWEMTVKYIKGSCK